jgi:hypothetical protein
MLLPGDRSHLERLLTTWSDSTGVAAGRLRRVVAVAVIANMFEGFPNEDGRPRIVFKGGAALEMRYGMRARSTKDLDAAFRGDLDEAVSRIEEAVTEGWSGFTGRVTELEFIQRAKTQPHQARLKIKLGYRGKDFVTIPFEMSSAEATSLQDPEIFSVAISLEPVQLDGLTNVALLPLSYQIAQKLHACTEPPDDDHPNDRVRDLPDLLLMEELGIDENSLPSVRAACIEIFGSRGGHQWPPQVQAFPGWDVLWDNLVENESLSISLNEAVIAVNLFINRINSAT